MNLLLEIKQKKDNNFVSKVNKNVKICKYCSRICEKTNVLTLSSHLKPTNISNNRTGEKLKLSSFEK